MEELKDSEKTKQIKRLMYEQAETDGRQIDCYEKHTDSNHTVTTR